MKISKVIRTILFLFYFSIPIISYFYIFDKFNLDISIRTLELMITSYIIIVGFFIGFYPSKILQFNEYVDDELKSTLPQRVEKLVPVFKRMGRRYSFTSTSGKRKKQNNADKVIPDQKYSDFFEKISNMYFVYIGIVFFFILMIISYLLIQSMYEYNEILFFFIFYYILLTFFYIIMMMFLTINALQTNKYLMKYFVEGMLLEKKFWQDMLTGFDIISELPDSKSKKLYLKAIGIKDIKKRNDRKIKLK